MQQLPYPTTNQRLALCLEFAGQPLVEVQNRYNAAKLEKLGCKTVKEAIAAGKVGSLVFFFDHTPELNALLAAFSDQEGRCKTRQPSEAPDGVTAEHLLRFACSTLCLLTEYRDIWKTASVQLYEGGEATETVTKTLRVTREMIEAAAKEGKKVTCDGREYQEGDEIPIEGTISYSPMRCVGIKVPAKLRAEVNL